MKFSEQWLREWVNPAVDSATLCAQLTMAGLEVDSVEPAAPALDQVVVARIASVKAHPDADKLHICSVDAGLDESVQIVCGAPNAAAGLLAPLALPGARLPGGKIRATKLRGVPSAGMLCGASELNLGDDAGGLLALHPNATVGQSLTDYLQLDDTVIEVDLTPNRGDCLSIRGIAREVGVWNRCDVTATQCPEVPAATDRAIAITLQDSDACPVYAGRLIEGIDMRARTPDWLCERLRRAGVRPISIIVDVTNYVMLELGQPMHAFDAAALHGGIRVRQAERGETLTLLDGGEQTLHAGALVIADDNGPVALAGVMGGANSAVSDNTRDIFLESAYFTRAAVAGQGRRYKRHTDALHRYERGVDPTLQAAAIQRATALIVELAGGQPGPVTVAGQPPGAHQAVPLRAARIKRLLGSTIDADEVTDILQRLAMQVTPESSGRWTVTPPPFRFDIEQEADLIEEVARIHGYNNLSPRPRRIRARMPQLREAELTPDRLRETLLQRGYAEAVTYSFVDAQLQQQLTPDAQCVDLDNPIAEHYAQMRTTLWSSLLPAWQYNHNRQQKRIRLFEAGLRFRRDPRAQMGIAQQPVLAGIISGSAQPLHWDAKTGNVDFFDLKGDVQALLALGGMAGEYRFAAAEHPALHPGRSAAIYRGDRPVGTLGQLHPKFKKILGIKKLPYLFEVEHDTIRAASLPRSAPVSDYPEIHRDLAVIVTESVTVADLLQAANQPQNSLLRHVDVFDVFRGAGLEGGFKSIALNLIFQHKTRTLEDTEVDDAVTAVLEQLTQRCGARIREQ